MITYLTCQRNLDKRKNKTDAVLEWATHSSKYSAIKLTGSRALRGVERNFCESALKLHHKDSIRAFSICSFVRNVKLL